MSEHYHQPQQDQTTTKLNDIAKRLFQLKFKLGLAIRYHNKRKAFFIRWDKFTRILSMIIGSASVTVILVGKFEMVAVILGIILTILSAIDSFIGFGDKARDYDELVRAYKSLESKTHNQSINDRTLSKLQDQFDEIEAQEPPTLLVLAEMCWNERS